MESREQRDQNPKPTTTSFLIPIPLYDEVVDNSPAPQSLFNPSPSFSQAFKFIKKSEFYTSPQKTSLPRDGEVSPAASDKPPTRENIHSDVPSTSVSSVGRNRNSILVSHRQKGNPLLKHIRNVRWDFADVVCDYLLGQNACALYLRFDSTERTIVPLQWNYLGYQYHLLHPDYLYFRIKELQKNIKLRVVLCHVDVEDVVKPLLEVTKTALLHNCTLLCGWSLEECGRYLETIKVYENKPADLIQGQTDMDYLSQLNHALTAVRHVNKTDVVTLGSTFGSLSHIMDASMEDLARCPGIGERKVKRLYDTFHEPFKRAVPNHVSLPDNPIEKVFGHKDESVRSGEKQESQDTNKKQRKDKRTKC